MSFYPLLGASLNCRLCFFPRDLRLRGPVSDSLSFAVTFMFFSLEYLPCCFLLEVRVASFLAHYSSHSLSHSCSFTSACQVFFQKNSLPCNHPLRRALSQQNHTSGNHLRYSSRHHCCISHCNRGCAKKT